MQRNDTLLAEKERQITALHQLQTDTEAALSKAREEAYKAKWMSVIRPDHVHLFAPSTPSWPAGSAINHQSAPLLSAPNVPPHSHVTYSPNPEEFPPLPSTSSPSKAAVTVAPVESWSRTVKWC